MSSPETLISAGGEADTGNMERKEGEIGQFRACPKKPSAVMSASRNIGKLLAT